VLHAEKQREVVKTWNFSNKIRGNVLLRTGSRNGEHCGTPTVVLKYNPRKTWTFSFMLIFLYFFMALLQKLEARKSEMEKYRQSVGAS
jgi:hypothetical protein